MKAALLLSVNLILFSSPAFPQVDMGDKPVTTVPDPTLVSAPGGRLYNFQGACHFRPEISVEDTSLLNGAKTALEALKTNKACAAVTPQINAFEAAMTNYNNYTGATRPPGYDGQVNINCVNYEQLYDLSYDFFVSNYSSTNNNLPMDYQSCTSTDKTEAINCAAEVTGRLKSVKRYECEQSGAAIDQATRARVIGESYQTALAALNAIINNNDCIDATGAQRMSFIQTAVGLAGRAANIGTVGVGGPLIGLATNLIGSLINKIFSNNSRNTLEQLENRANLAELACLYEKLEEKANRCDRVTASIQNDFSRQSFQNAQACLSGSHMSTSEVDRLLSEASSIITGLNQPQEEGQSPREFSQEMFDSLVEKLDAPFPGGSETIRDIGERAATEAIARIEEALSSPENLRTYLSTQNNGRELENREVRRRGRELREQLEKAKKVQGILAAIRATDSKIQLTSEDLQEVRNSLSGSVNFMSDFNEVLRLRISGSDDLSEQLRLYNTQLNQARTYQAMVQTFTNNEQRRNQRFDDNGTFELARSSLRPYLARMLESELDTLRNTALQSLSSIAPGPAPTSAQRDQRLTQEESVIYPILRACNQLQSVMNQGNRSGVRPTRINDQHEVCRAVTCGGNSGRGIQSFTDYLQSNNLPIPQSDTCTDQECTANYARYICQQKKQLPSIRSQISREFVEEGKLCGRPIRDALASRR